MECELSLKVYLYKKIEKKAGAQGVEVEDYLRELIKADLERNGLLAIGVR